MKRQAQRGVSLMEAVVALAVMGFGMLGVAAMQSSLRQNADIARQRAEAVRMAQDALERYRGYSVIASDGVKRAYDDITTPAANTTLAGTNASYTRAVTVATSSDFNVKTVRSAVSWTDRANNTQSVVLASQIHRVPPELAGALIAGGSPTVPQLRNGSSQVLPGWRDNGNGTFSPPITGGGGGSVSSDQYYFGSGGMVMLKTGSCASFGASPCLYYRVVQGYVAFSTAAAPTPSLAENPVSAAPPAVLAVSPATLPAPSLMTINQTAPGSPPAPVCYYEKIDPPTVKTVAYNCLIGVSALVGADARWSASLTLAFTGLATNDSDVSASTYRVCRYTRYRNDDVVGTVEGDTGLAFSNVDHPKAYASVNQNLMNQNYLIIKAGNGSTPYACPDDDTSTPVYGRTWQHQPNNP